MKKWGIGWLIAALFCVPIFLHRVASQGLLADTDTAEMLRRIAERGNPWSWFVSDWPLQNHFYRPISTLTFELDRALHGSNAAGYGLTNALLCMAAVLLAFWLARELTDHVAFSVATAGLFSFWILDSAAFLSPVLFWIGGGCFLLCILFGRSLKKSAFAALLWVFAGFEISGINPLTLRMIAWVPGRTASTMALFALISVAAYVRYERLSAQRRDAKPITPLDPPATKNTVVVGRPARLSWIWAAISLTACAFALGSYEQAVMLPSVLTLTSWIIWRLQYRVRWSIPIASFGILLGYLLLRRLVVPSDVSGYQSQQLRDGETVFLAVMEFLFPAYNIWRSFLPSFELGTSIMLIPQTYGAILHAFSNVATLIRLKPLPEWTVFGFLTSAVAFLPMAWLKPFDHYYFWPMSLRTFFVAGLVMLAYQATVSAARRPVRQAPPRSSPAPGSLPHR